MHEYGHYIDSDILTGESNVLSSNKDLIATFKKEFENFLKESNSLQQEFIEYFVSHTDQKRNFQEQLAETNMILNTLPPEQNANRAAYFQQYFP